MKNEIVASCGFGLREIAGNRRMVHLEYSRTNNQVEDSETFSLSFFGYNPLFRVTTREAAAKVLQSCPEWFNTSLTAPAWGQIDPTTLEVVELDDMPEFKPVKVPRPVIFADIVSTKCIAHRLCEELLKCSLPPHYSWAIYVVHVPAGESLETLKQKCEQATVHIGNVMLRAQMFCQAVLPAGPNQATLITTSKKLQEGQL